MAPQTRPQCRLSKYWPHIGQFRVISFAASTFSMVGSRGIRMTTAISDPRARQEVPSGPASKRQVSGKPNPKPQVQSGLALKQHMPNRTDSKHQVPSGPLSKQQAPSRPASQQVLPGKPDSNAPVGLPLTMSAQIDGYSGDPNFMTSLARGLAVIQAFSQRQCELTVSQISAKTGFSRAAVRRCLYTLAKLGFAATDDSRHFHHSRITRRLFLQISPQDIPGG